MLPDVEKRPIHATTSARAYWSKASLFEEVEAEVMSTNSASQRQGLKILLQSSEHLDGCPSCQILPRKRDQASRVKTCGLQKRALPGKLSSRREVSTSLIRRTSITAFKAAFAESSEFVGKSIFLTSEIEM